MYCTLEFTRLKIHVRRMKLTVNCTPINENQNKNGQKNFSLFGD
jgi:hypothetical protein